MIFRLTALKIEFCKLKVEQIVDGTCRIWRRKNRLVWEISFVQNFGVVFVFKAWEPSEFLKYTTHAFTRVYSTSCLTECSR
jgi:hypothetical protein